jgi:hypothetical protein
MQIERIVRKKNHANTTKKYEIRKNKCLIIKLKKKPWMWHNTELNWAKVIVPSLLVISIIFFSFFFKKKENKKHSLSEDFG